MPLGMVGTTVAEQHALQHTVGALAAPRLVGPAAWTWPIEAEPVRPRLLLAT